MSNLKTVQEEIEKALAASLKGRFDNNASDRDLTKFDDRDLQILRRNDSEGETYLRLFIQSRQGDLEKAYKAMKESLEWRKTYGIRDIQEDWFEENTVKEVLAEGILFYHNVDKRKNPILIFQGNNYKYKKDKKKEEVLEKLFAYLLEKQNQKNFGKQILVICDHHDAKLDHIDLNFFKFVVDLFNIYYPNLLDSFLVVDVSWRVSSAWRNIQQWLGPATSPKFKFVDKAQLLTYVDKSKLLTSLGGTDNYTYKYPPENGTQNPFDPSVGEVGGDMDSHGPFQDAIDHEERIGSISPEESSQEITRLTSESMGAKGSQLRNRRRHDQNLEQDSSSEDIPPMDEEIPGELTVSPKEEILFQEIVGSSEIQGAIKLENNSQNGIIFKIKTNSAANFRVKPRLGAVKPGAQEVITVLLLLKRAEGSQEKHQWNKDKFLILYAEHPPDEITSETDISELWKAIPRSSMREYRLNCRVLDVDGLEKRPKTIDDAVEMNLKLQKQIIELQTKINNFQNPLADIKKQIHQLILGLIISLAIVILLLPLVFYFFR